ncbi:MAG: peroxidase [Acidobacteria bacterium]|nr:peroxidase [Acidobacteriota bacterium]
MQKDDWTLAALDEKDRALLRSARKLNDTPGEMSAADIEGLRSAGFTDQNIFDVVVIVAYFNFMNRIADGLGVVPELEKQESYERHLREVMDSQRPAARPNE